MLTYNPSGTLEERHAYLREKMNRGGSPYYGEDELTPVTRIELWCADCGAGLGVPDEARVRPFSQHRRKAFTVTCECCGRMATGVFFV